MADKCKECGCICKQCNKNEQKHNDMHLHVEIENLRQRLVERDTHIVTMETQFLNEAEKFPNGELASMKEEILIWQDKYTRLYEAHKRVQKVNQNLEDKLLRIVDKCETEKGAFTKDIATLSHRLAEANYTIHRLTQDNEKYRNDVNLAIQLLQCKPSNFVGQKYESLPPEVQAKVRTYVAQKGRISEMPNTEVRSITVPISTFPPTAMVYNVAKPVIDKQDDNSDDDSKPPVDIVSAAIMAKVLEDREKERIFARHCTTCTCHRNVLKIDSETQTIDQEDRLGSTRDYFSKIDHNDFKNRKNNNAEFFHSDIQEMTLNHNKGHSRLNDLNAKRATFHCANEVAEAKHNINTENLRLSNQYNMNAKNYLNFKNSSKYKSTVSEVNGKEKPKSINNEGPFESQINLNDYKKSTSERKPSEESKNFDDQAKIDMINERLWKSSWMNSKAQLNAKDNQVQLDVINERVWRNNGNKKLIEKPATRMTVIEVRSSDDLTNESEKTTEPSSAASPSCSGDSVLISSSDPSSLSSDPVSVANKKDRPSSSSGLGPRNCLVRVTPGSNNILLDNQVSPYQTVLYTSGSSRPSTALVHLAKSSRSGRSASISSEENAPACSMQHENALQQRVAQWVDTIDNLDSASPSPSQEPLLPKGNQPVKLATTKQQQQADLMTFEASSEEEFRISSPANLTNQMEETYLKLAASLDSTSQRSGQESPDIGIMTIEKYRKLQKRNSFKNSQVVKHSST